MLATILKSPRATQTTLAIIDTFVEVREMARTMEALQNVADGGPQQQTLLQKTGRIQPENIARTKRNLVRHRDNLIRSASREVLHLQKAMEQMNLKPDNVFTDILGKSGQAIIKAILDGERDPKKLSSMADPRCKKSREEIEKSLANRNTMNLYTPTITALKSNTTSTIFAENSSEWSRNSPIVDKTPVLIIS